ncbi:putative E3 ubiquitin-protein ligase UBR7 isoform X1 [Lates japonicus]|uniref:E3 ubiquitin-protein ligase UBR7 isoform X1 n=1 Tax=Lates japonicus TaxID=270547 RepID=A0AAD3NH41_LATJO|nr:putative E3 ubiquitin-protein ligase UBR7 isoform X1 [Lates japonicus]
MTSDPRVPPNTTCGSEPEIADQTVESVRLLSCSGPGSTRRTMCEEQTVSLVDVLEEDEELEEEASAVLAGSDSDHCSYPQSTMSSCPRVLMSTCPQSTCQFL